MIEAQHNQLIALSKQDRNAFPNIIYQQGTTSPSDTEPLFAALAASREIGFPFVIDTETDKATGVRQATVRTATDDEFKLRVESALFHGAATVAGNTLLAGLEGVNEPAHRFDQARLIARNAISQVHSDAELAEGFGSFYAGLRWSTDQEKFVTNLFVGATEFDIDDVHRMVESGGNLVEVSYSLEDLDIPYSIKSEWHSKTPWEVLDKTPQLDYRRLREEPGFIETEEGTKLAEAYRKYCGNKTARLYKNHRDNITDDGIVQPRPLIPLSRFPIIEALVVDQLLMAGPTRNYSLGPREVTEMALDSDSKLAHQAIAESVTTRLPEERQRVFDGPTELEQKGRVMNDLLRAYRTSTDPDRKENFKNLLVSVLDAYTGAGAIATDLRRKNADSVSRGYLLNSDVSHAKTIIKNILTNGLSSPDAQSFLGKYMPDYERGLATEQDPLALTQEDMKKVVLDALNFADENSNPAYIENIARRVFKDDKTAQRIRSIIELTIKSRELTSLPEVRLARRDWVNVSSTNTEENAAAKSAFDQLNLPSVKKADQAKEEENALFLDMIAEILDSGDTEVITTSRNSLLADLLKRVHIGSSYKMTELPKSYFDLLDASRHQNATIDYKASVLWKIAEKYNYCDEEASKLMIKVALDGLELLLGDPSGDIAVPTDTSLGHGLAAISHLVSKNRVFRDAGEDELLLLTQYKSALIRMAERATGLQIDMSDSSLSETTSNVKHDDPIRHVEYVLRTFRGIEKSYEEFLHLEEVKSMPNVYYPWIMEKLVPFWNKMQWEVGPGNRPSAEIQGLHGMLMHHIDKLLVHDEYLDEDFDVLEQGNLGSLLLECYDRMLVSHNIKYNNTVSREGLSFVHNAVSMLPDSVVIQLKEKYSDRPEFISYVEKSRERFRK